MIRQAVPTDAPHIAPLIILAMDSLAAKFANSNDPETILYLFTLFAGKTGNQYSYENALVYENETGICGMILAYDGARLNELREPFLQYTKAYLGFTGQPEDETHPGEYYIDCLAVKPEHQGRGIATRLITALIDKAGHSGHKTIGLLVSNPLAEKLYTALGFKEINNVTLLGGVHKHLQYRVV
ncbi:GNAT family N-acetyltransferase [Mucilaginibacter pallidiroseus]|uniref:GNAT family N-acetyltransferase n=1 Tax=Mucilaginibacter pallidiroseus TaxID=2599295 RepID=A0A563U874_9SPHI|nr:GNAT family N-acetyltransferase [Mucilaginibacter pallidiroseus]TWR27514.1 GNAT family N-acetyltransferase [Mucilaginibacter pallidiroseus]